MNLEEKVKLAAEALDARAVEMAKWHFSPETGCKFWLEWAEKQDWNPLEEIKSFSDVSNKLLMQQFKQIEKCMLLYNKILIRKLD